MTIGSREVWIYTGYEIVALHGHANLKIEPLAKKVGITKSSFYHHFADLTIFTDALLQHHIDQSYIIAEKERNAQHIDPELIQILIDHRIDLLFSRELRIHSNIPHFEQALHTSNKIIGDAFTYTWCKDINHQLSEKQLEGVFSLALENFYLQINADNINKDWLSHYFASLSSLTNKFL